MTRSLEDTHLAAEITSQPDSWTEAARLADTHAGVLPKPGERVAVIGCGTSLHMARAYAAAREAAGAGETDAWPASEARLSRSYDRVVAVSRSGTTTEVLDALTGYDRSPVTVVTSSPGTPILGLGEQVLLPQFDEESVVQTRFAESYLATEYRHGPISIAAPGRVVWALGPLVPGFERDVAATGAHLEHRDVDPMADLVRVQRLCLRRAADRGLDPDRPRNLERSVVLDVD